MNEKVVQTKKKTIETLMMAVIGSCALAFNYLFSAYNNLISGIFLVLLAIFLYFYIVLSLAEKNWMDIRAVFSGVWFGTIGLATLRLTAYQEPWQNKTWILLGLTYLVFQVGAFFGERFGNNCFNKTIEKISKVKTKKIYFEFKENRLFIICVVTTLIGLVCFVANIFIKGYIPCFSKSPSAYVDFYTKFHIFSLASTIACGLCYYCIKTQKLSLWKKIVLWICILYLLIIYPIMIVSRGTFVIIALYFTTVVFYLNKRRFIALVLCVVIIFGVYMLASELRNLTDEQLSVLFDPVKIGIGDDTENPDSEIQPNDTNIPSFQLSPKMAFLYGYLTVGHDNFNEAVQNLEDYTFGTRTLKPFNVVLRIPVIHEISKKVKNHFVRPYLNTNNFLGEYYYDFHEWGVALLVLIFAFFSTTIQKSAFSNGNIFLIMSSGVVFYAVFLVFFANMACLFEFWMFLGLILIFAFISSINIKKHNLC